MKNVLGLTSRMALPPDLPCCECNSTNPTLWYLDNSSPGIVIHSVPLCKVCAKTLGFRRVK